MGPMACKHIATLGVVVCNLGASPGKLSGKSFEQNTVGGHTQIFYSGNRGYHSYKVYDIFPHQGFTASQPDLVDAHRHGNLYNLLNFFIA